MHVDSSVTVKTVGRISLNDGGKIEESEGYITFSSFSMLDSKSISSCA